MTQERLLDQMGYATLTVKSEMRAIDAQLKMLRSLAAAWPEGETGCEGYEMERMVEEVGVGVAHLKRAVLDLSYHTGLDMQD